jgi:hypothetical protein
MTVVRLSAVNNRDTWEEEIVGEYEDEENSSCRSLGNCLRDASPGDAAVGAVRLLSSLGLG